ncbi:MAG: S-methyl-5-thioribose-1-phosphate isomerase [Candidatus Bathyarchaeota archaeon]|nr:MAG: S-methyl-5-thioribose-1-phosphate isomerase [Candidatus Bathyarchaeota archaeon]
MYDAVLDTSGKIKRLEIRGARNVAIEAIKSLERGTKQSNANTKQELLKELSEAQTVLFASRSTEPLMRNAISFVIQSVESSNSTDVHDLVDAVSEVSGQFLERLKQSKEMIASVGSKRISDDSRILTHCHSSTVMKILKQAKLDGKQFELFCTESRPVFQGRLTAKEMIDAGIKTTMFVDSAVRHFINKVDFVVVGADAITSEGNVINKIGTSMVALAAKEARTPFYVATELLKFNPATILGDYEKIEERNPTEVWDSAPDGLVIRNPAFDVTRREFIHGIICEEGIVAPNSVNELINRKYPWILETT